ncbi:MAG: ABC transporter ATP-binding protein [Sphingobacteriales bacterium]|nr:MAG: ABC transporter ATP-binding protein [Sphingobacteriales bacterium]
MSVLDTPILSVNNLSISFPGKEQFIAVKNISFSLGAGETLAVVGESGSGKSLTALSMMGLLPTNASAKGEMIFREETKTTDLVNLAANEWQHIRGKEIAMVFQEPMSALNPVMKIGKQLQECILQHQNTGRSEAQKQAVHWLQQVQLPSPDKLYDRYPHQLSGGQKQRVMIAMAMCNSPKLLIADEPTTALDVTVQKEIVQLMQSLQQQYHMGMMFITHDLSLAAQIADKILVMYKGEVVEQGDAKAILTSPHHAYTKALIACKPSPEQKGKKLPTVGGYISAEAIGQLQTNKITITDENILEVKDLKVWFADETNLLGKATSYFKAVNDISFTLKKGETLGLVGESGCGKSTISRSLMGLLPIKEGQILFDGEDLAAITSTEWNVVRKDIQMVFQDPFASLNPRMQIGDTLAEPLRRHSIVSPKQTNAEVERLLSMVQLPKDAAKRYPHQFSGGQRQRIGIARALSVRPKLLICDESVSALDVSVQAQILNLLKELQAELGLSYLFVSHDLNVVYYMSDRVMVMQKGEIVEKGNAKDVLQHPSHPYTQKLIEAVPENLL